MSNNTIQPAIILLNMTGDVTISWDAENEATMLKMIEEKMKENFTFFIVKPRFLSLFGKKKVAATSLSEIAAAKSVVVEDDEYRRMMGKLQVYDAKVEAAVKAGKAYLSKSDEPLDRTTVRRAASAQEVVKNQSIAVRRVVGG